MDDVEALATIVGILKSLDEEDQRRVLASVHAFMGVSNHTEPMIQRGLAPVSRDPAALSSQDRNLSAKEFLRNKEPATDVDRVACLAYYLTHYRETAHFKTVDISSLNVEAAQPKFANTANAVDNARARGLLVPSTKGNKQLSALGERYVELLPDRDAARASMAIVKSRARVAKKAKQKAK